MKYLLVTMVYVNMFVQNNVGDIPLRMIGKNVWLTNDNVGGDNREN